MQVEPFKFDDAAEVYVHWIDQGRVVAQDAQTEHFAPQPTVSAAVTGLLLHRTTAKGALGAGAFRLQRMESSGRSL